MPEQDEIAAAIAHNLRTLRTRRGLTLEALAARCGVSRGMLIQLEQARTNPSIGTIIRVADALGISVARLVEPAQTPAIRLVRAAQAVQLWRGEPGSSGTLLVGTEPPVAELWDWRLAPGDHYDGEAHQPGTRELIYVLEGQLSLTLGSPARPSERATAAAGDVVSFTADQDHRYANETSVPLRFMLTVSQIMPWPEP
ncbi:MAG: helix-turn-helix domain-containing protein [Streptosporangiales bacterium]|nr:helix-turn-helix domain-containing protein [Streptosporangiales bacterium]